MSEIKKTGLDLMREPFPAHQISKLPKGTKAQNECPASEKVNCKICGGWHHPKIIHLDYVGHAALTDRLLDCDPHWTWEPMAFKDGLPAFDETGGLWIRLTVCGHSRIGYGHAAGSSYKDIGAREKEVIGDALRNAAMRFGAALELWHKGELHKDEDEPTPPTPSPPEKPVWDGSKYLSAIIAQMDANIELSAIDSIKKAAQTMCEEQNDEATYRAILAHYKTRKAQLTPKKDEEAK